MSTSNLSAAANDTLQSCSQTAQALIGVCRSGGNRVIGRVDAGWDGLVARHGARLSEQLRHDLVAAQREVTGLYAKGIDALTTSSTHAVQAVVNTATASVKRRRVAYLEAALAPLPPASDHHRAAVAVAGRDVAGFVAGAPGAHHPEGEVDARRRSRWLRHARPVLVAAQTQRVDRAKRHGKAGHPPQGAGATSPQRSPKPQEPALTAARNASGRHSRAQVPAEQGLRADLCLPLRTCSTSA